MLQELEKKSPLLAFFLEKQPLTRKFSKFSSEIFIATPIDVLCANFVNLADGKSVKSCVAYLTKKTKIRLALSLSLLRGSRSKSARTSARRCTDSAPDFIQIASLSAEL